MITPDGEVEAFVKLDHLLKRKNSYNEKIRQLKLDDLEKLKKFIRVSFSQILIVGYSVDGATRNFIIMLEKLVCLLLVSLYALGGK